MSASTTITAVAPSVVSAMGFLPHPNIGILPPILTEASTSDFITNTQDLPSWTAHDRAAFHPTAVMPTESEELLVTFSTHTTATTFTTRAMPTIITIHPTAGPHDAVREGTIHATRPTAGISTAMNTRIQARQLVSPVGTDETNSVAEIDPPPVFPPIHGPGWQPPNVQAMSHATIATTSSETKTVNSKIVRSLPDEGQIVLAVRSKREQVDSYPICHSSAGARSFPAIPIILKLFITVIATVWIAVAIMAYAVLIYELVNLVVLTTSRYVRPLHRSPNPGSIHKADVSAHCATAYDDSPNMDARRLDSDTTATAAPGYRAASEIKRVGFHKDSSPSFV